MVLDFIFFVTNLYYSCEVGASLRTLQPFTETLQSTQEVGLKKVGVVWENPQRVFLRFRHLHDLDRLPLWCGSVAVPLCSLCGNLIPPSVRMCGCASPRHWVEPRCFFWRPEWWRAARSGARCVFSLCPVPDFLSVPVSSTRSKDSHCNTWAQNKASPDPRQQASALSAGKTRARLFYYPRL